MNIHVAISGFFQPIPRAIYFKEAGNIIHKTF